jgi:hypothetical protein
MLDPPVRTTQGVLPVLLDQQLGDAVDIEIGDYSQLGFDTPRTGSRTYNT